MVASAQTPPTGSPDHQNQAQAQAQIGGRNMTPIRMSMPKDSLTAQDIGHLSGTEPLHISISLPYAQPAAMQAFVDDVSNPSSPNYRHFITPDEVGQRFGQSTATVQNIANYLSAQGMTIKLIGKNHLSILADATAAQAEAAFNTTIDEFKSSTYAPTRHKLFSFVTPPSMPAQLAPYVMRIGGLETFSHPKARGALAPYQIRSLYDVATSYSSTTDGEGITIGITNFDGYRISNAQHLYETYGIPLPTSGFGSNIQVKTIDGGSGAGFEGAEGDLDIQAVLGVAPACNLIIYDCDSEGDGLDLLTKEADDDQADIITESYGYGLDATFDLAEHNLHLAINAEGITYLVASGDYGTNLVEAGGYPDQDPEVLMVGGTTAYVNGSGTRAQETAWSGSSGGWLVTSDPFNVLPSWQKGFGVPTNINFRLVPDVSEDADPNTGYMVYIAADGGFVQIGGTSLASPLLAGGLGYIEQQLVLRGTPRRFGRINDLMYTYNGNPNVFFDVTSGYTGVLPNGQGAYAAPGWDFTTGWGTLDHNGFLGNLAYYPQITKPGPLIATAGVSVSYSVPSSTQDPSHPVLVSKVSVGPTWISYDGTTLTIDPPLGTKNGNYPFTINVHDQNNPTISTSLDLLATVATPTLKSVNFASPTAPSGSNAVLLIQLTGPAPVGGLTFNIAATNSYLNPPTTVVIPAGASQVTYTPGGSNSAVPGMLIPVGSVRIPQISGVTVTQNTVSSILATTGGSSSKSFTASIRVLPPAVTAISVPPNVNGGANFNAVLTLASPAPTGGLTVYLTSNHSVVSVPSSVTVPAGATSVTVPVVSYATSSQVSVTVSAFSTGTPSAQAVIHVYPNG